MKEEFKKVYPILLPLLCIAAGIISIVFFCCGPIAKGNYDILAIGCIAMALALLSIIFSITEIIKNRKKK